MKIKNLILTFGIISFIQACAPASLGPMVVAKVGDSQITTEDYIANFRKVFQSGPGGFASPEGRRKFLSGLIQDKILIMEAAQAGVKSSYKNSELTDALKPGTPVFKYFQDVIVKNFGVTDAEALQYFKDHSGMYTGKPFEASKAAIVTVIQERKTNDWFAHRRKSLSVQINEEALDAMRLDVSIPASPSSPRR